jgi:hypothetical protein
VTHILSTIEQGDGQAAAKLAQEMLGETPQATTLMHGGHLRLVDQIVPQQWDHRRHLFAAAAEAVRRILVENARRNARKGHGGEHHRVGFDHIDRVINGSVSWISAYATFPVRTVWLSAPFAC